MGMRGRRPDVAGKIRRMKSGSYVTFDNIRVANSFRSMVYIVSRVPKLISMPDGKIRVYVTDKEMQS